LTVIRTIAKGTEARRRRASASAKRRRWQLRRNNNKISYLLIHLLHFWPCSLQYLCNYQHRKYRWALRHVKDGIGRWMQVGIWRAVIIAYMWNCKWKSRSAFQSRWLKTIGCRGACDSWIDPTEKCQFLEKISEP